jgi:hypothetical protein
LLAFSNPGKQREVYKHILGGKINAVEVEKMASSINGPRNANTGASKLPTRFADLQDNLSNALDTPVMLTTSIKDRSGKIVIKYNDYQQLAKIAKTILD